MESTWGTSSSLLDRVRNQESGAWESLCRIYTPLVYGWVRKAGLNQTDAEDVVQEVFQKVAAKLSTFRYEKPEDSFRGWLWTICRNKVRDWFRARQAQPLDAAGGSHAQRMLHEVPDWISSEDKVGEPEVDAASEAALMRRALDLVKDDFNEKTWQAFWRLTIDGHPAREIASDLGMSDNAVRQAKFRVLKRLKEALG